MITQLLQVSDPGIASVVLMGMGIVFAGILAIILICKLLPLLRFFSKKEPDKKQADGGETIKPDGELAAVIGAAIAEELGCDISGIRIVSVKKVSK